MLRRLVERRALCICARGNAGAVAPGFGGGKHRRGWRTSPPRNVAQLVVLCPFSSQHRTNHRCRHRRPWAVIAVARTLLRVRAPAGLDLGTRTPEEIALCLISEIVLVRRNGSGRRMCDTLNEDTQDHQPRPSRRQRRRRPELRGVAGVPDVPTETPT